MGGTLTAIHAAQHPGELAALVTLAAPIDFARGGMLRAMVDPSWFDPAAIADAGNVDPAQMQAGFVALRPTLELAKLVSQPDLAIDPASRASVRRARRMGERQHPVPGRSVSPLHRRPLSDATSWSRAAHRVGGRSVELSAITCPVLAITASRDTICPPPAATALLELVGSTDTATLEVAGGHVGAVVGSRAAREMYPALARWLGPRLGA